MPTKPPPLPDENHDWDEQAKTTLDVTAVRPVSEVITAPHDVAAIAESVETEISKARDEACRLCWAECQADALAALRSILLERGLTNDETAHVMLLFRGRLTVAAKARELSRERQPAKGEEPYRVPARPAKKWTNEAVVAALVLTGVERDEFDSLLARYGKMRSRRPKARK